MRILDFLHKRPSVAQSRRLTIVYEYECDFTEPQNEEETALVAKQLADVSGQVMDILQSEFGEVKYSKITDELIREI